MPSAYQISHAADAIRVVGLELRTHNGEAMHTIGPHWGRFMADGWADRVPGRVGSDVYAVYTHFEHAGLNNTGWYSLVIGVAVEATATVPAGLVQAVIPAGRKAVFASAPGQPQAVVQAWQTVWATELPKTFVADAERYQADGQISLLIGLHPQ